MQRLASVSKLRELGWENVLEQLSGAEPRHWGIIQQSLPKVWCIYFCSCRPKIKRHMPTFVPFDY